MIFCGAGKPENERLLVRAYSFDALRSQPSGGQPPTRSVLFVGALRIEKAVGRERRVFDAARGGGVQGGMSAPALGVISCDA